MPKVNLLNITSIKEKTAYISSNPWENQMSNGSPLQQKQNKNGISKK